VHYVFLKISLFRIVSRGHKWLSQPLNTKRLWYAWTLGLLGSTTGTKKQKQLQFTCMEWFQGKREIIRSTKANSLSSKAESEVKRVKVDNYFNHNKLFHFTACRNWWLNLDGNSEYSSFSPLLAVIKKSHWQQPSWLAT